MSGVKEDDMAERMRVRDLMSDHVATVTPHDSVEIADGVMAMGRIRHLPVLQGSEVVGILSQRDLFRSALGAAMAFGMQRPQEIMRALEVGDVMTTPPVTIGPEAAVQDAARAMAERRIGCLPVLENGRLVGILTDTDILRYATNH
jgi:CBS domain-containing protein